MTARSYDTPEYKGLIAEGVVEIELGRSARSCGVDDLGGQAEVAQNFGGDGVILDHGK
ncbi:MAG: hypothetical protein H6707_01670 [Deltaproteobacteria bacterium]|nr:hypothetical protein [Deltaproteobacteria bacterium]